MTPTQADREKAESVWYGVTSGAETYQVKDVRKPMLTSIAQALADQREECAKIAEGPLKVTKEMGNVIHLQKEIAAAIRRGDS